MCPYERIKTIIAKGKRDNKRLTSSLHILMFLYGYIMPKIIISNGTNAFLELS